MIVRDGPKPGHPIDSVPRPDRPTVSVVIPVHGHQPLIAEQLAALAAQTYPHLLEVLVCDNGCDEPTLDLVSDYAAGVPGLRTVDARDRPGASFARNRGVEQAKGELIAICDSDDVVSPGWVEVLSRAAHHAEIVGGHVDF
ncbi:MAG TPA: glycosyltransferase family A protein, partial [Isosphaeraceae bacterium]|nr:glycosyltransferase family A protein [Isosphaeraceae bacterium]